MWLFLWFIVAAIILGATAWSSLILYQQKQAWQSYAKKHGLVFIKRKFFEPSEMNGVINGYNVSFFTAEQQDIDERKNRLLTVIQINTNEAFVDGFACVSPNMQTFLGSLAAIKPHKLKVKGWNPKNFLSSRNKGRVDVFMTEERVKILTSMLSMKNADVLVLSDETEAVIRIETSNPLQQEAQIEKLVLKLLTCIKKLKVSDEERVAINAVAKDVVVVEEEIDPEAQAVQPAKQKPIEEIIEEAPEEIVEGIEKPKKELVADKKKPKKKSKPKAKPVLEQGIDIVESEVKASPTSTPTKEE